VTRVAVSADRRWEGHTRHGEASIGERRGEDAEQRCLEGLARREGRASAQEPAAKIQHADAASPVLEDRN